tara:strand:- start:537 stop:1199 length:663 start_codon:yes stop_codon:yes gene_type:complete
MAVIGSKDSLNRDPSKMQRFIAKDGQAGIWAGGSLRALYDSSWVLRNDAITSFVNTNAVSNTPRTIYSVSGKGGSLIWAFGSNSNNSTSCVTTYVITVDGVATTFNLGTQTSNFSRGIIGSPAALMNGNTDISYQINANSYVYGKSGSSAAGGVVNNNSFSYSQGNTTGLYIVLAGLNQPMLNPQACTRFENSLTISVTVSEPNSDTNSQAAGCLVLLDD